jgi:3-isopropylmalate dehydrogenase
MAPTRLLSTPAVSVLFPERPASASPHTIGFLAGDGIGPELTAAAQRVLAALAGAGLAACELRIAEPAAAGGGLSDGEAEFFAAVFAAGGAVLCGPRRGRFVYELRRRFDLFLKLSPLHVSPARAALSRLKPGVVAGADVLVVRDNAGGVYQGAWDEDRAADGQRVASHRFSAHEGDVRRVVEAAAALAERRRGRLAVVGKEDGIPSITRLWREVAGEVAGRRGVAVELVNVDFAAYRLVQEPRSFDVLVCPNLEGDVLADVGAVLLGSRGLSFSGNFTPAGAGVFQTNHGAAGDLAGRDQANPLGHLAALAMLLREGLGLTAAADRLDDALEAVLASGLRTADLAAAGNGAPVAGTREITNRVIAELAAAGTDG